MTNFTFFTAEQKAVSNYTAEELHSGLATAKANLASAQRVGAGQGTIRAMQEAIEELEAELAEYPVIWQRVENQLPGTLLDNEKYTDLDSLLNSPEFQAELDSLILPASDNMVDNLEDTGRFPG